MHFQVKYWFESNSRDRSGEQVVENIEADTVIAAANAVQENLATPSFTFQPQTGATRDGGLIVVQSAAVRYVEIIPVAAPRIDLSEPVI